MKAKRKPTQIRIKPEVMHKFRKMCREYGFKISGRMEQAMLNDIKMIRRKLGKYDHNKRP